ncbi:hypothetical protein J6590_092768 [Homalodisca vitripennis]|nr:hypothetical protein J6590_092768 [Homalodisca vitripennis]
MSIHLHCSTIRIHTASRGPTDVHDSPDIGINAMTPQKSLASSRVVNWCKRQTSNYISQTIKNDYPTKPKSIKPVQQFSLVMQ